MMKRILSFALVLCLVLGLAPSLGAFAFDAEASGYTEAEGLFMSLGIIDKDSYEPMAKLTRAEFAYIIAKTARLVDDDITSVWQEENFGDIPQGTVEPATSMFDDVDPANEYYEAIAAVKTAGYMNGVGENLFAPDLQLITSEAVKVIVDTLGYDVMAKNYGGYPNGYLTAANKLKLLSGVGSAYNEFITKGDLFVILGNALDVGVGEFVGISDDYLEIKGSKENSFLTEVMGIAKVEGRITDNGITAVSSPTKLDSDYMSIGGIKVIHSKNTKKYRSLIGRYVTAYYDITDETKNILVHVEDADSDVTEISADNFASYTNGVITYYDGKKNVDINIGKNARMIYNGAYMGSYAASDFDIEDGNITVIDASDINLVIVEDMKNVFVSTVTETSLYNKLSFAPIGDEIKSINLEEGEEFDNIDIISADGKTLTASDIGVGDVLSVAASKNGEYAKIIVSEKVLSASQIISFDGENYETSEGEITASQAYTKAINKNDPEFNALHDIYLNAYGKIVWVEKAGEAVSDKVAILLDAADGSNGFADDFAVKFYTDNGKITVYKLSDKLTLNGKKIDVKDALSTLKAEQAKPVLYVEKDGIVTKITTPAPYGTDGSVDKRGWYKVTHDKEHYEQGSLTPNDWNAYRWKYYYIYSNAGNGAAYTIRTDGSQIGPRASILTHNANTKFYSVPTNPDDFDNDKFFSIVTKPSFPENAYFAIDGYSRTAKNPSPEVMIQRKNAKGSGTPGESSAFLITKVKNGVNVDEDNIVILEGYDIKQGSAKKNSLKVNVDAIMLDEDNEEIDVSQNESAVGPRTYKELEAGDIIRYSTNALGEINTMRISFDYNTKNAFERSGGYHTASYGAVMSVNADALKVVTGGLLPENFDYSSIENVTSTRVYPLLPSSVVIIAEKDARGSLTFRMGTAGDIIAYENTLVPGEYDNVATVAHWFGGFLATVIYR